MLASGVVIVQVVANPLISLLGKARTAHSRLTFAQAFNSLGISGLAMGKDELCAAAGVAAIAARLK